MTATVMPARSSQGARLSSQGRAAWSRRPSSASAPATMRAATPMAVRLTAVRAMSTAARPASAMASAVASQTLARPAACNVEVRMEGAPSGFIGTSSPRRRGLSSAAHLPGRWRWHVEHGAANGCAMAGVVHEYAGVLWSLEFTGAGGGTGRQDERQGHDWQPLGLSRAGFLTGAVAMGASAAFAATIWTKFVKHVDLRLT